MIIANTLAAVATPLSVTTMRQSGLTPNLFTLAVVTLCAAANVAFAVALFKWQKWGFYGFIVTCTIALVINLYIGVGIGHSLTGLIGFVILYWVLNIGGANKAWPRLK